MCESVYVCIVFVHNYVCVHVCLYMYQSPVAGSVASALGTVSTVALTFRESAPSRTTHTTEPGSFSLTSRLADVRFTCTAIIYCNNYK